MRVNRFRFSILVERCSNAMQHYILFVFLLSDDTLIGRSYQFKNFVF